MPEQIISDNALSLSLTLIEQFNLYKTSHPNLVHCWVTYLALKKRNYGYNENSESNENSDYNVIFNYLKSGEKDYSFNDIMRILIFKMSLLDETIY
jgi:hypothetical protein